MAIMIQVLMADTCLTDTIKCCENMDLQLHMLGVFESDFEILQIIFELTDIDFEWLRTCFGVILDMSKVILNLSKSLTILRP